jgi:glycine/D-amino acid oxidase-like deaminating enzyme
MLNQTSHIAIIGAGFAGCAVAFYLLSSKSLAPKVTIYHQDPVGIGASGVASGLLHPFPAGKTRLSFQGFKALHAALMLLNATQDRTNLRLYQGGGILKLALEDEEKKNFAKLSLVQEGVVFYSQDMIQKYLQVKTSYPGLLLQPGYTVYCKDYLAALASVIQDLGGEFIQAQVDTLERLHSFDKIIVCAGAGSKSFSQTSKLQLVKGQILTMEFPFRLTSKSLIGEGYIAVTQDPYVYHVGSSYEHHFKDPLPELEVAKKKILDPWINIFPEMKQGKIISCDAGLRLMHTKNYLPLIQKLNATTFSFSALGSRGLLYHAYVAQKLVEALERDSFNGIEKEFLE